MRSRDFDAMVAAGEGRPQFTIGGQKFTARSKLPWKKFGALIDAMTADDAGIEATESFLCMSVVRADRERFRALLDNEDDDDDESVASPAQINALASWLMEHYTGKLSENDESSSDGPSSTGPQRRVVSLSRRAG